MTARDQGKLRIGTRRSPLALWQAERVQALLGARGHACELVTMTTQGDQILDRPLAQVGGKGLFVKELEEALADGRADLSVHSAKDVPFALPAAFRLCAFLDREDPRDALVAPRARTFGALPRGARVGTSSLRRAVQLLAERPDLEIVAARGNVATRLSRATGVKDGQPVPEADRLDAVILALAGLRRLGLEGHVTEIIPPELSLPAAGQGALAIEAVAGSAGERAAAPLDVPSVARRVRAERAVLVRLSGSCTLPIAAHAIEDGPELWLRAALGGPATGGGVRVVRAEARGPHDAPEALGTRVAELLLEKGGEALLSAARLGAGGLPPPRRYVVGTP
jgi:hydroxymethylbilane synthase